VAPDLGPGAARDIRGPATASDPSGIRHYAKLEVSDNDGPVLDVARN
jgi:hypothetical protein